MSLIKLANAVSRAYFRGELKDASLKAVKDRGMLRSGERMLAGMNTGTENIAKAKGYTIHDIKHATRAKRFTTIGSGGYTTDGDAKEIYHIGTSRLGKLLSPMHSVFHPKRNQVNAGLILAHEAHEAQEAGRGTKGTIFKKLSDKAAAKHLKNAEQIEKGIGLKGKAVAWLDRNAKGMNLKEGIVNGLKTKGEKKIGKQVGAHFNLAVLGRESSDVARLEMHGLDTSSMHHARKNITGEKDLIKRISGKEYGQYMSRKDIRRLRNAKHDGMIDQPDGLFGPTKIPFFHT